MQAEKVTRRGNRRIRPDGTDIFEVKKLIEDIATLKVAYASEQKEEK